MLSESRNKLILEMYKIHLFINEEVNKNFLIC